MGKINGDYKGRGVRVGWVIWAETRVDFRGSLWQERGFGVRKVLWGREVRRWREIVMGDIVVSQQSFWGIGVYSTGLI